MESQNTADRIYKLDKFTIPNSARSEFVPIVVQIMALLKTQAGHIQSFMLEQPGANGDFYLVTLAEWENKQAIENAREVVASMQRAAGLNPAELMTRLGIQAQMDIYSAVHA